MRKYRAFALSLVTVALVTTPLVSLFPKAQILSESTLTQPDLQVPGDHPAGIDTSQEPYAVSTLPNEASNQWGLGYLSVENIWAKSCGSTVVVAVLDTGIDSDHPDLSGKVIQTVNFSSSPTVDDIYGHGTHVAGIIGASINGQGTVGVDPYCRFFNVKVAEDDGTCKAENVSRGIKWSVDNGASIINISIQLAQNSPQLEDSVEYARTKGVFIVAASGNNTPGKPVYPACYEPVVAVTAITPQGELAPLANMAEWVDFAAPGYEIYSVMPDGLFSHETGTSFAAAHVSGFMALLYGLAPGQASQEDRYEATLDLLNRCSREITLQGFNLNTLCGQQLEP